MRLLDGHHDRTWLELDAPVGSLAPFDGGWLLGSEHHWQRVDEHGKMGVMGTWPGLSAPPLLLQRSPVEIGNACNRTATISGMIF
jgi:hypothetical protein